MINHYLLLRRLGAELHATLQNAVLRIVYSPQREDLQLLFEKEEAEYTVKLNFATDLTLLSFWPDTAGKPRQYEKQFTQLWGATLLSISAIAGERMLCWNFDNGMQLWMRFFGRQGNVLLTDENGKLVGPFRRIIKNDYLFEANLYTPETDFSEVINEAINTEPIWWKKRPIELVQSAIDSQAIVDLLEHHPAHLLPSVKQPGLGFDNTTPGEVFSSVIAAYNAFFRTYLPDFLLEQEKRRLIQPLADRLARLLKKREEHQNQLKQLAKDSHFEHWGNLLLSSAHLIAPAAAKAEVQDYLSDKQVAIKLDPKKSVIENASRYFQKAKNQLIEAQQLENLFSITQFEVEQLQGKLLTIQNTNQLKLLRKLAEKSITIQEFPFRRWTRSGLEIWMGKNGRQNDELLRQVHKDDIWLHARNHSGSHVVIRSAGKKVPQPVLEAAACWAAWHSKGKSENLCAVMYTQRKFVRKPKGALPGAVIVEKESTLLVQPSPPPAS